MSQLIDKLLHHKPSNRIYMAGDLFDHKHLAGNKLLADAIDKHAADEFECLLPQDIEFPDQRGLTIRDMDLAYLITSDVAVFQFDGCDLDSGTVAEFMMAKMLDIPALLIRTDFRQAGDQQEGDPWNLMCSNYPRSLSLQLNSLGVYHQEKGDINAYYAMLADTIVAQLRTVKTMHCLFEDMPQMHDIYSWAFKACGPSLDTLLSPLLPNILERKLQNGYYNFN